MPSRPQMCGRNFICKHKGWPTQAHWWKLLWVFTDFSGILHPPKAFVICEELGWQCVGLCALSHGVGQGHECILAKPGSHQQWASGAGELPKLPYAVCQLPQKTSVLHVIYYLFIWMDSRVHSPACFTCRSGSTRELWEVLPLRLGYSCLGALEQEFLACWWSECFWTYS